MAEKLHVSRQAVEKLLKGGSKEMGAGNNANAARLLGVDPTWLATGEGVARPGDFQVQWPERLLLQQFRELPKEDQADVAMLIQERLELKQEHAGKRSADPYQGAQRPAMQTFTETGVPVAKPKAKKSTR